MGASAALTIEFFRHFREIGSLVPDSGACCRALLKGIPFGSARVIFEYGAGSGKVTREILRRKRPDSILVSFEKNRNLHRRLSEKIRAENFFLVNADVLEAEPGAFPDQDQTPAKADCIVSTLPCSSLDFDRLVREAVLPRLEPGPGVFIQYTHTISAFKGFRARPVLDLYFREVRRSLTLKNLPPSLIYTCRGPR